MYQKCSALRRFTLLPKTREVFKYPPVGRGLDGKDMTVCSFLFILIVVWTQYKKLDRFCLFVNLFLSNMLLGNYDLMEEIYLELCPVLCAFQLLGTSPQD